jgi:hypothetical protein
MFESGKSVRLCSSVDPLTTSPPRGVYRIARLYSRTLIPSAFIFR